MHEVATEQAKSPPGAVVRSDGVVTFRVWAPDHNSIELVSEAGQAAVLSRDPANGLHSATIDWLRPGVRYGLRIDGSERLYPDPASRFQPDGPHGLSEVVDPAAYQWKNDIWDGPQQRGQVIYELHIGTFTAEGTWKAAIEHLSYLKDLGVTMLEVMPVADFPGRFGWGYDGVDLWAPTRLYGRPDDFRAFIDAAHGVGLNVILDVVYNHFGPDGNYLRQFAPQYFTERYWNEWGDAINFDGEQSGPVREFFIENAAYWIRDFRLDGLRLDATQSIHDFSSEHILAAMVERCRIEALPRTIYIVGENEPQDVNLIASRSSGGFGLDALWNDDFHHSAHVALTGIHDAYYSDYFGKPQELISAVKWGFLYQGQRYMWQQKPRGTPALEIPAHQFVNFLENHDQVANSTTGEHLARRTDPASLRALTALLLLAPGTPLLFQGQDFGSSSPFLYFADHHSELAVLVASGRKEFLGQFRSIATAEVQRELSAPHDDATFEKCKLDSQERIRNEATVRLHRDLLALRRNDPAFSAQDSERMHGAVLGDDAFLLRWFPSDAPPRLLIVNLGREKIFEPAPEPLLAPPAGSRWEIIWSSESPQYGGAGTPAFGREQRWHLAARSAVLYGPIHERRRPKTFQRPGPRPRDPRSAGVENEDMR